MVVAEGSDDSNPLETRVNQLFSKIQFILRSKQNSVSLIYEGESTENLKSAIKILTTARLSCKLTTMILMV